MAAGQIYKYTSNVYLYYRDSSNVERRCERLFTGVGSGFVSSVYTTTGMVDGRMVAGNWGTVQGHLLLLKVFAGHLNAWRFIGFTATYAAVKPTGAIRISGTNLQMYFNGAWVSNAP